MNANSTGATSTTSTTTNTPELDYYYSAEHSQYLDSLKTQQISTPKKAFWQTGVGTGLSSLWSWATNNPQQVVNLVAPKRAVVTDPRDPNFLQSGGFVGGVQTPEPQPQQGNNNIILIVMGVVIVGILFLIFKKQ